MAENNLDHSSLDDVIQSSKRAQEIAESVKKIDKSHWETVEYKKLAERMHEEDRKNRLRELNAAVKARDYYAQ